MNLAEVEQVVYPDDCDAFGHLNQAAFLRVFERARWDVLGRGPGMDVFVRHDAWPAVRKTVIDYLAPEFPGDALRVPPAPVGGFPRRCCTTAEPASPCARPRAAPVTVPWWPRRSSSSCASIAGDG